MPVGKQICDISYPCVKLWGRRNGISFSDIFPPHVGIFIVRETNYTENNLNVKIQNVNLNFNMADQKP